jgi:hypothetical protein
MSTQNNNTSEEAYNPNTDFGIDANAEIRKWKLEAQRLKEQNLALTKRQVETDYYLLEARCFAAKEGLVMKFENFRSDLSGNDMQWQWDNKFAAMYRAQRRAGFSSGSTEAFDFGKDCLIEMYKKVSAYFLENGSSSIETLSVLMNSHMNTYKLSDPIDGIYASMCDGFALIKFLSEIKTNVEEVDCHADSDRNEVNSIFYKPSGSK